jgi:Tfp pilus assembly protein PilO
MENILKGFSFILLGYGLYSTYLDFEQHTEKVNNIENFQIPGVRNKIRAMEKKIGEISKFKDQIDEYEEKISSFSEEINTIKIKIPPVEDKTSILDELANDAKKLNLQSVSFKPLYEKENSGGIYFTNGIEFQGTGTYLQFMMFFERLGMTERIFNVQSMEMKNFQGGSRGRYRLVNVKTVIETYHYNESYIEKIAVKEGKKR